MSADRTCPSCGQPIDALRAPVVRVVGGRVVAYCSQDCKDGRDHTPLPEPAAPETDTVDVDLKPAARLPETAASVEDEVTPVPPPPGALISAPVTIARPRRTLQVAGIAALLALAVGGGTLLLGSRRKDAPEVAAAAVPPSPAASALTPEAVQPAPPPEAQRPLDPKKVLGDARALLTASVADPSPRVRLLAARALSRTGDPAALKELGEALEKDPSEIRRLETAYALARAGETRGTDYLVAALKAGRRDVRLEAARALALMKDTRGGDRLREALGIVQLRLGAAESLAILGDKEGLDALREALAGKVEENRMRAAVALGRAGDDAGKDLLVQLIGDEHLEVGAEDALARLGDARAVPALTRALGLSAIRVQAAVGLRRLAADVDLGVLAAALETGDEVGKISAAEALLVLLLPEPPAELK